MLSKCNFINLTRLNHLDMKERINAWGNLMIKKYDRFWQYAKDYSRKCKRVYERMYSI